MYNNNARKLYIVVMLFTAHVWIFSGYFRN